MSRAVAASGENSVGCLGSGLLASPPMLAAQEACPICGSDTAEVATIRSDFSRVDFSFLRCGACGLVFVANPRVDFASLYDAAYYRGEGADSFVQYIDEMGNPATIRAYEWRRITRAVQSLCNDKNVKWLDFGCGLGGLVGYARAHGFPNVYGYDQGWGADWAREHGTPLLDEDQLREHEGTFDVVTAIEIIEHIPGTLAPMAQVASLVKPGSVFFPTSGNAAPHRDSFTTWKYLHPDIHVAYFEPRALSEAYCRVGSRALRRRLSARSRGHLPLKGPQNPGRYVAQPRSNVPSRGGSSAA